MAREVVMLPKAMVDTFAGVQKQQLDPNVNAAIRLDDELGRVLRDEHMTAGEKAHWYNETLSRYLSFREKFKTPSLPVMATSRRAGRDIVSMLARNKQPSADKLLSELGRDPKIFGWNENLEIFDGKNYLPNTNIADIIDNLTSANVKNRNMPGMDVTLTAMKRLGVPNVLVKNKSRLGETFDDSPFPKKHRLSPPSKKRRMSPPGEMLDFSPKTKEESSLFVSLPRKLIHPLPPGKRTTRRLRYSSPPVTRSKTKTWLGY